MVITILTWLGAVAELDVHVPAGLRHGLTRVEIEEVVNHLALYAGAPRAVVGELPRELEPAIDEAGQHLPIELEDGEERASICGVHDRGDSFGAPRAPLPGRDGVREYPAAPLVGVGVVLVDGERILVVRRSRPPSAGQWSLPGGLVDRGEDVETAARREISEECGLEIQVHGLVSHETLVKVFEQAGGAMKGGTATHEGGAGMMPALKWIPYL